MSTTDVGERFEGIAIIGMAGRFPGAGTIDAFWQNLRDGVESISFFSDEELSASGIDPLALNSPNYVKARGVFEGADLFDAEFFGFNPREAEITDPQHRLFLECAWEALEHAGYDSEAYDGLIGVFAGAGVNTYLLLNLYSNPDIVRSMNQLQLMIANEKDYLSTRTSYKLNLRGPSVNVNTACSTSLVAVHLACQSLWNGECDMALAGGVSLRFPQKEGHLYQDGGILSPDGHCRAFDAEARGTVGGNGVAIVALKRLADALADGDHIHAVIKGSAINNDGALKAGYTAPSVEGQAEVIAEALAVAGIDPDTIGYVEAHGTGTPLGDPIEVAALTLAFRTHTLRPGFCALGSVKSNVGHLDAAAGVAGLIKAVLALQYRCIPPSLHFQRPNPQIDFANSPFFVPTSLAHWPAGDTPRRAAVSSFGIGGTNAHVILEEAPPASPALASADGWSLLRLSARSSSALDAATANLASFLRRQPDCRLADLAFTLRHGRRAFAHRRILVCRSPAEAQAALETCDPQWVRSGVAALHAPAVVFLFPGQGAQYVGMGRELYEHEPVFREQVDRCCELLASHLGCDLRDVLFFDERRTTNDERDTQTGRHGDTETRRHGDTEIRNEANTQSSVLSPQSSFPNPLDQTWLTQPALFVVEYALAQLWLSWGVRPAALLGHSVGEYVAACLAGVFALDDALALVAARGRLMQQTAPGAMLAVALPEAAVQPLLGDQLDLAAVNRPDQCVIAGPPASIETLAQQLSAQGVVCRRLPAERAFHSRQIEPILEPLSTAVARVRRLPPQIPLISNVSGDWATAAELTDPAYWAQQARQPVRFADGVRTALADGERVLLEVGPGHSLSRLARKQVGVDGRLVVASGPGDGQVDAEHAALLEAQGRLWLAGVALEAGEAARGTGQRVALPTYPFERQRYWIAPGRGAAGVAGAETLAAHGKYPDLADWFYVLFWKPSVAPAPLEPADLTSQPATWLLFLDDCGIGACMARRLEHAGQDVVRVLAGERFDRIDDRLYSIDPRCREDYTSLLADLRDQGNLPQQIAHLWSVTPRRLPGSAPAFSDSCQDLGFYSLMFLAQALGEHHTSESLSIGVVSNGVQDVAGEGPLCPEKATILGPCKVIPREYPAISCRNIDIVAGEPGAPQDDELVDLLIAEMAGPACDAAVAYRRGLRWVQDVEAVQLRRAANAKTKLRDRGIYLITGGLGGIGLVFAEHLVKTVRARLALVGRTAIPARDTWEQWLASHDQHDPISHKIAKIQALEALGGEILLYNADVADQQRMQVIVTQVQEQFGPINGVIHAAGIAGGGMIQRKTAEAARSVLVPKVDGTLALYGALKDVKLDFLALFSSISSILGEFGQADYCAANAFLDAFACWNSVNHGMPTVSINWDTWNETGMALNATVPAGLQEWREENLKAGILSEEGLEAFDVILNHRLSRVIVSTRNLRARIAQNNAFKATHYPEVGANAGSPQSTHQRPALLTTYVAPRNEIERSLVTIWQETFGIEQIGVHDDFFELGGHSLLATQLLSRISDTFLVRLPLQSFFDATTVAKLAAIVEQAGNSGQAERIARILNTIDDMPFEEIDSALQRKRTERGVL